MNFETKRLILRQPKKSDWKDILDGIRDIQVSKMLSVVPHPYKKKDALSYIKYCLNNWKKKKKTDYIFVIVLKSERKVIGATALHDVSKKHKKAETGSWINRKYWRKGYILEAKIPILDFAFNRLKLRKIETGAFKENDASNSMSKKLGFVYEGMRRKSIICKATGKIEDVNVYGLLKEEWKKIRPKLVKELNEKIKKFY